MLSYELDLQRCSMTLDIRIQPAHKQSDGWTLLSL